MPSSRQEVEDFISQFTSVEHHGVKGMHWGVRKSEGGGLRPGSGVNSTSSPSRGRRTVKSNEIRFANHRLAANLDQLEAHAHALSAAKTTAEKKQHLDAIHSLASKTLKSGDIHKAHRITGRSGVGAFVAGSLIPVPGAGGLTGLAAHGIYEHHKYKATHALVSNYANSSLSDYH